MFTNTTVKTTPLNPTLKSIEEPKYRVRAVKEIKADELKMVNFDSVRKL